jgi:hypothetical protein
MGPEGESNLPSGYWLDRSDPDMWMLRRAGGWVVAHFSAQRAMSEAVERVAWEDYVAAGEEEYP